MAGTAVYMRHIRSKKKICLSSLSNVVLSFRTFFVAHVNGVIVVFDRPQRAAASPPPPAASSRPTNVPACLPAIGISYRRGRCVSIAAVRRFIAAKSQSAGSDQQSHRHSRRSRQQCASNGTTTRRRARRGGRGGVLPEGGAERMEVCPSAAAESALWRGVLTVGRCRGGVIIRANYDSRMPVAARARPRQTEAQGTIAE